MAELICNKCKCTKCGDVIISHHTHDYVTCSCRSISTDGGNSYLHRSGIEWLEDQSVYSDAAHEIIRENLYRGSRGKNGDQPLTWVKMSDMDDDYIVALLEYMEQGKQTRSVYYGLYATEWRTRTGNEC
jgi:hypothetical protein